MGHVYGFSHVKSKNNKKDVMIPKGFVNKITPDQDDKKVVKHLKKISYNRYNDYQKEFPKKIFRGTFSFSQVINRDTVYFKNSDNISEETEIICAKHQ